MTAPAIEYFLTSVSPWTYIGHDVFVDLAGRHGATIAWRPVKLGAVFNETGGLPLPKRAPARQHYRLVELQRWRDKRGVSLNVKPKHFPTDPSLSDRTVIALDTVSADPAAYLSAALRAVWVDERDIADETVVSELLSAAGHDAAAVLAKAKSDEIGALYDRYTQEAVEKNVFGAPTYILGGEAFWGQDRLDLLEDALTSGRAPYAA